MKEHLSRSPFFDLNNMDKTPIQIQQNRNRKSKYKKNKKDKRKIQKTDPNERSLKKTREEKPFALEEHAPPAHTEHHTRMRKPRPIPPSYAPAKRTGHSPVTTTITGLAVLYTCQCLHG